jgi:acyl carrier protein
LRAQWCLWTGPLFPLAGAALLQNDRSMGETTMLAAISTILSTHFDVPAELIRPETRLADLDLDSVALVELAAMLEDELDLDVSNTAITMQDRIGDLAERLSAAAGIRPAAGNP